MCTFFLKFRHVTDLFLILNLVLLKKKKCISELRYSSINYYKCCLKSLFTSRDGDIVPTVRMNGKQHNIVWSYRNIYIAVWSRFLQILDSWFLRDTSPQKHFFLLSVVLFIHPDCLGMTFSVLDTLAISQSSLQYHGTPWHFADEILNTFLGTLNTTNKVRNQFHVVTLFFPFYRT